MSKARIIKLLKILQQETDYRHGLNSEQLITRLQQEGENVERKTIYDDIRMLNECGYIIDTVRSGDSNGYYYDSALFDGSELRILTDAVNAASFITDEKTGEMTDKLLSLTNNFDRQIITGTSGYTHSKTTNKSILYNIDALQRAIFDSKRIMFNYFFRDIRSNKYYRRNRRYQLIPYALIWNQQRYYLIGYDEKHQDFANYRVDRMEQIEAGDTVVRDPSFDLKQYMEKTFDMFTGEDVRVILRCKKQLAEEISDQFATSKIVTADDEDCFEVSVGVKNTLMFYGWIFKFGSDIEIVGPPGIRDEYCRICQETLERYGK